MKTPISFICGFYGTGKTSVVSSLVSLNRARRFGIIVNSIVGGVPSIDAHFLQYSLNTETSIVVEQINGGCCSTSHRQALINALSEMANRSDIDHIVFEATGEASPTMLADVLGCRDASDRLLSDFLTVDGFVSTVDYSSLVAEDKTTASVVERTIKGSNFVVLNKVDLMKPDELRAAEKKIGEIHAAGIVLPAERGELALNVVGTGICDQSALSSSSSTYGVSRLDDGVVEEHAFASVTMFTGTSPFHEQKLSVVLDSKLSTMQCLLRAKGIFWLSLRPQCGAWSFTQSGGFEFSGMGAFPSPHERRQEIAFIHSDKMAPGIIERAFNACLMTDRDKPPTDTIPRWKDPSDPSILPCLPRSKAPEDDVQLSSTAAAAATTTTTTLAVQEGKTATTHTSPRGPSHSPGFDEALIAASGALLRPCRLLISMFADGAASSNGEVIQTVKQAADATAVLVNLSKTSPDPWIRSTSKSVELAVLRLIKAARKALCAPSSDDGSAPKGSDDELHKGDRDSLGNLLKVVEAEVRKLRTELVVSQDELEILKDPPHAMLVRDLEDLLERGRELGMATAVSLRNMNRAVEERLMDDFKVTSQVCVRAVQDLAALPDQLEPALLSKEVRQLKDALLQYLSDAKGMVVRGRQGEVEAEAVQAWRTSKHNLALLVRQVMEQFLRALRRRLSKEKAALEHAQKDAHHLSPGIDGASGSPRSVRVASHGGGGHTPSLVTGAKSPRKSSFNRQSSLRGLNSSRIKKKDSGGALDDDSKHADADASQSSLKPSRSAPFHSDRRGQTITARVQPARAQVNEVFSSESQMKETPSIHSPKDGDDTLDDELDRITQHIRTSPSKPEPNGNSQLKVDASSLPSKLSLDDDSGMKEHALRKYARWRKRTSQSEKHYRTLKQLHSRLGRDSSSSSEPPLKQIRVLATIFSEAALELIVTCNEHVLDPDSGASLRKAAHSLHLSLLLIVRMCHAASSQSSSSVRGSPNAPKEPTAIVGMNCARKALEFVMSEWSERGKDCWPAVVASNSEDSSKASRKVKSKASIRSRESSHKSKHHRRHPRVSTHVWGGKPMDHVLSAARGPAARIIAHTLELATFRLSTELKTVAQDMLSCLFTSKEAYRKGRWNELSCAFLLMSGVVRLMYEKTAELLDVVATSNHVSVHKAELLSLTSAVEGSGSGAGAASPCNIWEEKDRPGTLVLEMDEKEGVNVVMSGSFNRLVAQLTSDTSIDNRYLKTFITTYRSFTTPWQLFEKLLERYQVDESVVGLERVGAIRMRVCVVLKYWVENQFFDFDDALVAQIFEFVDHTLKDFHPTLAERLSTELKVRVQDRASDMKAMFIEPRELYSDAVNASISKTIMDAKEMELAEQLTLVEFSIYQSIEPSELLDQAWNRDKLLHRAPNVLAMIQRSNALSWWVATAIVSQAKKSARKKLFAKFVNVAHHLRELHNYQSLMGVISGLNTAGVSRLRCSKEASAKTLKRLRRLEEIMSVESAYARYRAELHASKPPCIPYLALYLKDLVSVDEGNSNFVGKEKAFINFHKLGLSYRIMEELLQYQITPYTIAKKQPLNTYLTVPLCLSDKLLFDLSLLLEPRN